MVRRAVSQNSPLSPRRAGTSKIKVSFVLCLSVSVPAIATIALMFAIVSVAPSSRDQLGTSSSSIKFGEPIDPVGRVEETKSALAANRTAATLPTNSSKSDVEYHIIFSTGCSIFQDWQSYVFFYFAKVNQQPGTVTRIASGCSLSDQAKLQEVFDEQIASMVEPGRFRIHFTQDYSRLKPGVTYRYWNKPFGTKNWMEKVLGFPTNPLNERAIVILMDPDQLIVRPFRSNDFSKTVWAVTNSKRPNHAPRSRVEHGKPMGQMYGFGLQWKKKINMKLVLPEGETTPIDDMPDDEAREGYMVGPPYAATARDMYRIVTKWTEFSLPVHDQYPHLLAEMFAYCLAAAHLKLAHQTAASFMVSDTTAGAHDEGWLHIDDIDPSEVCQVNNPDHLPNVLHFCQRYGVGYWSFGKYRMPENFLTCEHALFREPPPSFLAEAGGQVYWPGGGTVSPNPKIAKRHAFMTCHLLRALNEAAEYYKKNHCPGSTGNFNKTFTFFGADKY